MDRAMHPAIKLKLEDCGPFMRNKSQTNITFQRLPAGRRLTRDGKREWNLNSRPQGTSKLCPRAHSLGSVHGARMFLVTRKGAWTHDSILYGLVIYYPLCPSKIFFPPFAFSILVRLQFCSTNEQEEEATIANVGSYAKYKAIKDTNIWGASPQSSVTNKFIQRHFLVNFIDFPSEFSGNKRLKKKISK